MIVLRSVDNYNKIKQCKFEIYFQVLALEPSGPIQMISELPKVRFIVSAKQGLIYASSISQIWCLQAVDVAKQRKVLLDAKKFELALKLTVRLSFVCWVV